MAPEIITYSEAKARGFTWYFTGKPCKYGHVAERWTSDRHCMACVRARRETDRARRIRDGLCVEGGCNQPPAPGVRRCGTHRLKHNRATSRHDQRRVLAELRERMGDG